jgi:hypothetical protein
MTVPTTSRSASRCARARTRPPKAEIAAARSNCSIWCSSPASKSAIRSSFRAASGSAWRWPARWPSSRRAAARRALRRARRQVRKELRKWLREIHDRTGHTTVFVTHDQEEALELADRVVVMSQGDRAGRHARRRL